MSIWQSLTGKKTHCTGCGVVIPVTLDNKFDEIFCSEACERNYRRLSSIPPPPPEDEMTETREISFFSR